MGLLLPGHQASPQINVNYGGPVAFSFPCNDNPRYLTQELQVPVNNETAVTSWKGIFYIDQWLNHFNIKLDIVLDKDATIEVNPRVVHLIDLGGEHLNLQRRSFRLTTLQPPNSLNKIEFKVEGVAAGEFPSVVSLNVNGIILCDNKERHPNTDLLQRWTQGPHPNDVAHRDRCGIRNPVLVSREEDGNETTAAGHRRVIDWPWRISLWTKETATNEWRVACGGTLIGQNTVLTGESVIYSIGC